MLDFASLTLPLASKSSDWIWTSSLANKASPIELNVCDFFLINVSAEDITFPISLNKSITSDESKPSDLSETSKINS